MGEAGAVVVAFVIHEDLGFVFEAPKGGAMNYPIAIALEAGPHRMVRFGDLAAAAVLRQHRVGGQAARLDFFEFNSLSQHRASSAQK